MSMQSTANKVFTLGLLASQMMPEQTSTRRLEKWSDKLTEEEIINYYEEIKNKTSKLETWQRAVIKRKYRKINEELK